MYIPLISNENSAEHNTKGQVRRQTGWEHLCTMRSNGVSQIAGCSLPGTMLDPLLSNWAF